MAEHLMRNDTVDKILEGLIEFLEVKKIKKDKVMRSNTWRARKRPPREKIRWSRKNEKID